MYSNIKLKCFTIKLIHNNLSMDILHKNILLCHDKLFLEFNTENVMLWKVVHFIEAQKGGFNERTQTKKQNQLNKSSA